MKIISLLFPPSIRTIRQESPLAYVLIRQRPMNNYWLIWGMIVTMLFALIYYAGNRSLLLGGFLDREISTQLLIYLSCYLVTTGVFLVSASVLIFTKDLRRSLLARDLYSVPLDFSQLHTMIRVMMEMALKIILWALILGGSVITIQIFEAGFTIDRLALFIIAAWSILGLAGYNHLKWLWLVAMRTYFEGPHGTSNVWLLSRSTLQILLFLTGFSLRHSLLIPIAIFSNSSLWFPLSFLMFIIAELGATWRLRNLQKRIEEDFALIADQPVPRHFFDEETKPGFFITGDPAEERSEILGYPPFRLYRGGMRKVNQAG